jgi:hypothetical protein
MLGMSAFSAETVIREEKRVFGGDQCTPKSSCLGDLQIPGLKEVGFWMQEYRSPADGKGDFEGFNSTLYAWYETPDHRTLEDFAFVQYVRGCIFSSVVDEDGSASVHYSVTRWHLGERKRYVHLDWEVDARFADSFFDSNPDYALRHYFLEWNKNPERFATEQGALYGEDPPLRPRLFIRHQPYPFAHMPPSEKNFAINHSLEYRTCLYRTLDIPRNANGVIPDALACFDWGSSHVYDHKLQRYISPKGIVSACKPEVVPDLKQPW